MRAFLVVATFGLALFGLAGRAQAGTMVLGEGLAHTCAVGAIAGQSSDFLIDACTVALTDDPLTTLDRARTYVNRGVLYMRRERWQEAAADFDLAQRTAPQLAEVYVNRGCLMISEHRYEDAIAETDKGLALTPSEPEKAYYNRAIAHEMLDQIKDAYLDYRKASTLKPDWAAAQAQVARFTVVPNGGQK